MRSLFSATENHLFFKLINLHSLLGAQIKKELLDIITTFRRAREKYHQILPKILAPRKSTAL